MKPTDSNHRKRIQKDFEWLGSHPEEKQNYKGEYIPVVGEKIVAHGVDLAQVMAEAKQFSPKPLIASVPEWEGSLIV